MSNLKSHGSGCGLTSCELDRSGFSPRVIDLVTGKPSADEGPFVRQTRGTAILLIKNGMGPGVVETFTQPDVIFALADLYSGRDWS